LMPFRADNRWWIYSFKYPNVDLTSCRQSLKSSL
jgi:hypothetical protein